MKIKKSEKLPGNFGFVLGKLSRFSFCEREACPLQATKDIIEVLLGANDCVTLKLRHRNSTKSVSIGFKKSVGCAT
jgi:hypothetical protein